ncbi:prepilin-type N-terminal cleavage/methylation domain-containing protein [Psychromonas sp.]|nr:prepilin-type N-terminal cleavage/methylation domain-containing protein [Psychromonas sp.]
MAFRQNQSRYIQQGFTLIELVIVIIVLAVLTVVALPKLTSKSAYEDYAVKDQLIARLRLVQLQNMNADPASCYWVVAKSACFYNEHTIKSNGVCAVPSASVSCDSTVYSQYNVVSFSNGILIPDNYRFDNQGRLETGNSSILFNGENNLSIKIESEGYIHE